MFRLALLLCVVGAFSCAAFADLPELRLGTPEFAVPLRIAKIGPDLRRIGPWIEYTDEPDFINDIYYDSFERDWSDHDGDGNDREPGDAYYGEDCGLSGARFYLNTYCNPFSIDDMTLRACPSGQFRANEISFLWRWNPLHGSGAPSESCIVAILTADDVAESCVSPAMKGTFDGVMYDFGDLPDGFWYADISMERFFDLSHPMPPDGNGAIVMVFAQEEAGSSLILATCAQPGLWGTKNGASRWWGQGAIHWDDSRPTDGTFDPATECFDYTFGVCPDPLGTAIMFRTATDYHGCFTCGDCNCDGVFDGADIDAFFLALGDKVAYQKRFPFCDRVLVADTNGDNTVDGADIEAFFAGLGRGWCP